MALKGHAIVKVMATLLAATIFFYTGNLLYEARKTFDEQLDFHDTTTADSPQTSVQPLGPQGPGQEQCDVELREQQLTYYKGQHKGEYHIKGMASYFSNKMDTDQIGIAHGIELLQQQYFCEGCKPANVCWLDVGGNIGQTVEFMGPIFMQMWNIAPQGSNVSAISFEPTPHTYTKLKRVVDKYKMKARTSRETGEPRYDKTTYFALNVGVGPKRQMMPFYSNGYGDQGATFDKTKRQGRPMLKQVLVMPLDSVVLTSTQINEKNGAVPGLPKPGERLCPFDTESGALDTSENVVGVKIDIEGFEMQALRGLKDSLTNGLVRFVVWEWVPEKMTRGSMKQQVEYMASFGFEVFMLTRRSMIRLDGMFWDDLWETGTGAKGYKTLNLVAHRAPSPYLDHLKKRFLVCRPDDPSMAAFVGDDPTTGERCGCWERHVARLPPFEAERLKEEGWPMGRGN